MHLRRASSFGVLPAEVATPLVMVLNELLLNAVEHGFPGGGTDGEVVISVAPVRAGSCTSAWPTTAAACRTTSTSTRADRLGLQIVRTLGPGELRGIDRDASPAPAAAPRPSWSFPLEPALISVTRRGHDVS